MSRWWRAYDEALDDPKLQGLQGDLFKTWFNVCCLNSANGGTLPTIEHIAFRLRMTTAKAAKAIEDLRAAGLIDADETGMRPHNWNARQYKGDVSTTRVKRFRERHRNGDRNGVKRVSETPPESDTEQIHSSEPKGSAQRLSENDPKKALFERGRQVLGSNRGGLIAKLLKSFGNEDDPKSIAKARGCIEEASTKANPAEWLGRVLQRKTPEFQWASGIEGVV